MINRERKIKIMKVFLYIIKIKFKKKEMLLWIKNILIILRILTISWKLKKSSLSRGNCLMSNK
jgi:hypothetical protein